MCLLLYYFVVVVVKLMITSSRRETRSGRRSPRSVFRMALTCDVKPTLQSFYNELDPASLKTNQPITIC